MRTPKGWFEWVRLVILVVLVAVGVLWVMAFDRCVYGPAAEQPRTGFSCFVGSLTGTFVGLYLSAAVAFGWLMSFIGGR